MYYAVVVKNTSAMHLKLNPIISKPTYGFLFNIFVTLSNCRFIPL